MDNPIRDLNDAFRKNFSLGKVILTSGIQSLGKIKIANVLNEISNFNSFSKDNDPYDEHDFGSIEQDDGKVFWKIDYYDLSIENHSEDAADESKTIRVMTVMLAEEY
jgi:Protein of unknown function (DUF3768)